MPKPCLSVATHPLKPALMSVDVLALVADSVICTDETGHILLFNPAAEEAFGYSADEVIGKHVEMLLPQQFRAQHPDHVRRFAEGKGAATGLMGHRREVLGRRKNGEEFASEASVSRQSVDGRTVLTVVHRNISERKELEEQREAISRELDHRIRNLFSVFGSLVSLSARHAASVGEFEHALQHRLKGLAATQTLLRRDAGAHVQLRELLLAELSHYCSPDGANLVIRGAPIALCPTAVQPFALAFHELATNSAKYGAFSVSRGRVTVTSDHVDEGSARLLAIEWLETGGPPVKPPSRQGFGTRFIEHMIRRAFGADVVFEYRPEGLICRMTFPRAKVEGVLEP